MFLVAEAEAHVTLTAFSAISAISSACKLPPPALQGWFTLPQGGRPLRPPWHRLRRRRQGSARAFGGRRASQSTSFSPQKPESFFRRPVALPPQPARLLPPQLLLEPLLFRRSLWLDFPLIHGPEQFMLFLLLRLDELAGLSLLGQSLLFVGILGCLPPAFQLLRVKTPLPAVVTHRGGVLVRRPTATAQRPQAPP